MSSFRILFKKSDKRSLFLPVYLWIHGGGMQAGYRVNIFGWMSEIRA